MGSNPTPSAEARELQAEQLAAGPQAAEAPPVDAHRAVPPVTVGLVAQAWYQLAMEGRAEALAVPDHVADPDVETAAQVLGEAQRCVHLAPVVENVAVAESGVLDPDRRPVEADGVAAAGPQVDQPEDVPRGGDHEVGADVWQLARARGPERRGRRCCGPPSRCAATATCSTITRGWRSLQVCSP